MLTNGGKGYGSLWNMGVLCMMSTLLIAGLLVLGLVNVTDSYKMMTCLPSSHEEGLVTISRDKLIFRPTSMIPVSGYYLITNLIDEDGNILGQVDITSGSNCPDSPVDPHETWYCFAEDLVLENRLGKEVKLNIKGNTTLTDPFSQAFAAYYTL